MTTLTFHVAPRARPRVGGGRRDRRHRAGPSRQRRALAGARARSRRQRPHRDDAHRDRPAGLGRSRARVSPRTKLAGHGRGVERARHDQRRRARRRARARAGALVFVDAVHYAPHALVDVRALGCDLLACSAYKFYGPHVGVLYGPSAICSKRLDVPKLEPAADIAPERLETGTQNHEGIVGARRGRGFPGLAREPGAEPARGARTDAGGAARAWTAAGDASVGGAPRHARRDRLRARRPRGRARPPSRSSSRGRPPTTVARHCAERGLFVSNGDFYAMTVVRRLGHAADGLVGWAVPPTRRDDEVERAIAAIGEVAAR